METEKIIVYKLTDNNCGKTLYVRSKRDISDYVFELLDNMDAKYFNHSTFTLNVGEMLKTDYEKLPEFDGC